MDSTQENFSDALRAQIASQLGEAPEGRPLVAQAPQDLQPERVVSPATPPSVQPQYDPEPSTAAMPPAEDPRMAKIIEQARQARAEREELKREREQFVAEKAELMRYRELKARAKEDPIAWAEEGGYKPDEYATNLLDKGSFTPERQRIMELMEKQEKTEQRIAQFEKQQQEAQRYEQYSRTIDGLRNFASQEGDRFDLVRRTGDYNLVLKKFDDHYQKTALLGNPEILPWDQAFEQAENEILTRYEPVIESPKIRSRLGAPAPQSASYPAPAVRPSGSINPKNRGTSSPPRELSHEESLEQAGKILFRQFGAR